MKFKLYYLAHLLQSANLAKSLGIFILQTILLIIILTQVFHIPITVNADTGPTIPSPIILENNMPQIIIANAPSSIKDFAINNNILFICCCFSVSMLAAVVLAGIIIIVIDNPEKS